MQFRTTSIKVSRWSLTFAVVASGSLLSAAAIAQRASTVDQSRPGRGATPLIHPAAETAIPTIRVAQWNVTNYPNSNSTRDPKFQTAIYGVNPANGLSMSPDLFCGQEFQNAAASVTFKNMLNSAPGSPGDWAVAPFTAAGEAFPDTNSAFFYRTSKFTFLQTVLVATGSSATTNQPRNTYRYDVRLKGFINNAPELSCYSVHLKAQESGSTDDARRLVETTNIRNNAVALSGANQYYLFAGDTNITTSSAAEYQKLVGPLTGADPNAGRFYDPINTPGSWNNNAAYKIVLTQEPSTQMDDRHDQILLCSKLLDNVGFDYVYNNGGTLISNFTPVAYSTGTWNDLRHSYRCWGNDGTTYNVPIKTAGNSMVGQTIAEALIFTVLTGGHLPVFLDLKLPTSYVYLSGNIALENWTLPGETLIFTFTPTAGGADIVRTAVVPANGAFSFTDIPVGQYTMRVKGRIWLSNSLAVDGRTANQSGLGLFLLTGDVDGNNAIDLTDLVDLLNVYGGSVGGAGYLFNADLDGNGLIDLTDLISLLNNYGQVGH